MNRRNQNKSFTTDASAYDGFDVTALLHPAQAFTHPADVVNDANLRINLARWAARSLRVWSRPDVPHVF